MVLYWLITFPGVELHQYGIKVISAIMAAEAKHQIDRTI